MSKPLRVHTLAKELGVPSKEIIAKCRAEGIDLKNHMAAISVGLAESIREWFSAGADVTTIEEAPPVDLEKVRKARKIRHEATSDEEGSSVAVAEEDESESETADESVDDAAESEAVETEAPTATTIAASAPVDAPAGEALVDTPIAEDALSAATAEAPPEAAEAEETQEQLAAAAAEGSEGPPEAAPPTPPEPPKPATPLGPRGPQLVPKPAELQGPRVVRIEAPEPVFRPRPRPASPAAQGPMSGDFSRTGGAGGTTGPRRPGPGRGRGREEDKDGKSKLRSPRKQGKASDVTTERLREWRDQDLIERKERLKSVTGHGLRDRRAAERRRQTSSSSSAGTAPRKGEIEITTPIILKEFCAAVGVPFTQLMRPLIEHTGKMMTINQSIDAETAELLALDLGLTIKIAKARSGLEKLQDEAAQRERNHLQSRPPVVAMLGHVDHGKTSLLDRIRRENVAKGEAGGITQHIGAYRVDRGDWHVAFLDTPGHEAFTSMRARGANMTDVVVLVVAADDGIMPQTLEAINHAKAAGVSIVVALNKIDLPGVDINRIYGQLAEHELTPTEWGGETDVIKTSATTGAGVDDLIAHLSTLSEILELKADPTVPAVATVIESQQREGRGATATVLVREGTLKVGQTIVCGPGAGRVRALLDHKGKMVKEAGPATPVEVVGLDALPSTGDTLYVVDDLSRAKDVAAEVASQRREQARAVIAKPTTLEDLLRSDQESQVPDLNIIVRADGQGSVESLVAKLREFPSEKARLNILQAAVGAITEADVVLAQASKAVIIGLHIVAEDRARQLADQVGVEIRLYRIIYEVLDDVEKALEGLLEPERHQETRGKVEVREVFNISRIGTVAGCYVLDGVVGRNHHVRLIRDGRIVVDDAALNSLKRFKDDAKEVRAGFECGIKIEGYDDIKPGDIIEAFEIVEVAQKL